MWGALILGVSAIAIGFMLPFAHFEDAPEFLGWVGNYMPIRLIIWFNFVIMLSIGMGFLRSFYVALRIKSKISECPATFEIQKPE